MNAVQQNAEDVALRTSYQLQAANFLSQYPSLSRYFALKAVDSKISYASFHKNTNSNSNDNNTTSNGSISFFPTAMSCNESTTDGTSSSTSASITTTTTTTVTTTTSQEKNASHHLGDDYICSTCGLHLSPGHFQTTVRLRALNRGPTRRRRASRYQASLYTNYPSSSHPMSAPNSNKKKPLKEWNSVSISNSNNNNNSSSNNNNNNNNNNHHVSGAQRTLEETLHYCLTRTTDGEATNCVVYTCGGCHTKKKFKGVPVMTKCKQKEQIRSEMDSNTKQPPKKKHPHCKKKKMERMKLGSSFVGHSFTSKNGYNNNNGSRGMKTPSKSSNSLSSKDTTSDFSGDFISLGNGNNNGNNGNNGPTSISNRKGGGKDDFMSPLQQSKKKKRKRGKSEEGPGGGKKSGLMDFLASLND